MNKEAADKVMKAKMALILSNPYFGQLVMRLDFIENNDIPAPMGTDGTNVYYRANDVIAMQKPELMFVIAHEISHCMYGHPWRREHREGTIWNYAGDFCINLLLEDCGFTVDDKYLKVQNLLRKNNESEDNCKERYRKNNADKIYKELLKSAKTYTCNCVLSDGNAAESQEKQIEWKEASLGAANVARQQGKLPGALEKFVGEIGKPKVNWLDQLRFLVQQIMSSEDYRWTLPSKRYIPMGIFLPSLYSERMPAIQGYVDASGSCWDDSIIKDFASELQGIMHQVKPDKLFIDYFDTQVYSGDVFETGDDIKVTPKGGGGTCFKDIVKHIKKENRELGVVIVLTDGYGTWPDKEPDVPFIWVINNDEVTPPWGEVIRI